MWSLRTEEFRERLGLVHTGFAEDGHPLIARHYGSGQPIFGSIFAHSGSAAKSSR
jgi:hypothetical protein